MKKKTLFGYSGELKEHHGVVPQRAPMKSEDYTPTDRSLFFPSFELESFLKAGCFL